VLGLQRKGTAIAVVAVAARKGYQNSQGVLRPRQLAISSDIWKLLEWENWQPDLKMTRVSSRAERKLFCNRLYNTANRAEYSSRLYRLFKFNL